jgi:hypothetical protein
MLIENPKEEEEAENPTHISCTAAREKIHLGNYLTI